MSLAGKTVVVTGGGTGIGAACALAFAQVGANVFIAGRRLDKLQEVAARAAQGEKIEVLQADVSERDQAQSLIKSATEKSGKVDILINCAGINILKRQLNVIDPADWDQMFKVNTTAAFNTIHAVLPQMRARQDGIIVNISSVAGLRASLLGGVAYSASKFAMTALGTCVGLEERNNGIRVTNVYPGEVETPILDARPVAVSAEHRAKILQPEDVAAMILAVAQLPPRAHVPDLVIKPLTQEFC